MDRMVEEVPEAESFERHGKHDTVDGFPETVTEPETLE